MVNPVGPGPQQASVPQTNPLQQQEVRQRNDQTQARQAPPADSQRADQRLLQSKDDNQRRQNHVAAQKRVAAGGSDGSQPNAPRGQLLDITA